MLIYIRGVLYNAEKEDIGILLNSSDKININNMQKDCCCYIAGPKLTEEKAEKISKKLKARYQKKDVPISTTATDDNKR